VPASISEPAELEHPIDPTATEPTQTTLAAALARASAAHHRAIVLNSKS
jgi:hypothetical protein